MNPTLFRSRAKTAFVAAAAVFVIGLAVWPGCATPPLPTKRTPIHGRVRSDFKEKHVDRLTRAEVFQRLGQPDAYVPESRVAVYRVNDAVRRKVWLLFFIIPVNVTSYRGVEFAFIEFDENDRVTRAEFDWNYNSRKLDQVAREWLRKNPVQPQPHRQKSQSHRAR